MAYNYKMFVKIQKLTFRVYANINVMQGLVNIGNPCVLFLNQTHNDVYKHVNYERKFSILPTFMYQRVTDDTIY